VVDADANDPNFLCENSAMSKSVKGVFRNGHVELLEPAPEGGEGHVIVTFLASTAVDLAERGIDEQHAADIRHRRAAFTDDWNHPDMDSYDAL
jgi:hypothetical protein